MTGCWTGSFLVEQRTHCKPNCWASTCCFANHIWCIRKEYTRTLEPGHHWLELQCSKNVLGDGPRSIWRVSEATWGKDSKGWRSRRATRVDLEETGRSCFSGYKWRSHGPRLVIFKWIFEKHIPELVMLNEGQSIEEFVISLCCHSLKGRGATYDKWIN